MYGCYKRNVKASNNNNNGEFKQQQKQHNKSIITHLAAFYFINKTI